MRFILSSLAVLAALSLTQAAVVIEPRQAINSTSTNNSNSNATSSSSSAASPAASNSVATCQANTPSGQYVSFSSGYANVCCVGEPSICYYRQQNSLPSSQQCQIPSCADLNSGNASLMKGFVDLNSGGASNAASGNGTADTGSNISGQSSAFGGTSAFPDQDELSAAGMTIASVSTAAVMAGGIAAWLFV